jgi:competence protein ComK
MDIETYEINKDTCAILNLNNEVSQIIENNQEYLLPKPTFQVMEDSCAYYGSSYDGRIKGTKMMLGCNYKLPIIVEESNDIIFFPTNGLKSEKCSWISLNQVLKYEPYKGYTKVTFIGGKNIILKMSYSSFEMQILRATRLQNLIKKRAEK